MSNYYGTLTSDKGTSTRAGHRFITATAQSYDGSIGVSISDSGWVSLRVEEGSVSNPARVLWEGNIDELTTDFETTAPRFRLERPPFDK